MAVVYITPGLGTGANDGSSSANAFRSLTAFAAAGCAAGSDVRQNRNEGILFGDATTRIDITNPSGTTFRYTWDGTGTDPNFATNEMAINDSVIINSTNFNAGNNGTFLITTVTDDYFEVTNAAGVAENDKLLSAATSIKLNDSSTSAVTFTNNINGTILAITTITGYDATWTTKTLRNRNGTGAGANVDGIIMNGLNFVRVEYIEVKNYTRDGIRDVTGSTTDVKFDGCSVHNNGAAGINKTINGGGHWRITNCLIYSNATFGVYMNLGSPNVIIDRCSIYSNTTGISSSTAYLLVNDCLIYSNITGVILAAGAVWLLRNCVIDRNTSGITSAAVSTSGRKQIVQCRITNNTTGITLFAADGLETIRCGFAGNTAKSSLGAGAVLYETSNVDMAADGYVNGAAGNYNLANGATPAEARWTAAGVGDATNYIYWTAGLAPNPDFATFSNVAVGDTSDGRDGTNVAPAAAKVIADAGGFGPGAATTPTLALANVLTAAGGTFDEAARNSGATAGIIKSGETIKQLNVDILGTYAGGGVAAPAQITGVEADPVSSTTVRVSWALAPATGGPAAYYRIYRNDVLIATVTDALEYVDGLTTPLTPATTYNYKVSGVNDTGEGTKSDAAAGTTLGAADVPSANVISQLFQAIRNSILEITDSGAAVFTSANVLIGEIFDFSTRKIDGFPCVEIFHNKLRGGGDNYESQRQIQNTFQFEIVLHTWAATSQRDDGTDLTTLTRYASAILRQLYRYMDRTGALPCDGFLWTDPTYTVDPQYEVFSENVNSEIITVSFRVDTQDTEL